MSLTQGVFWGMGLVRMPGRLMIGMVSALAFVAGAATLVYAETTSGAAANAFAQSGPAYGPRKTLEFDSKSHRWGLKLGVQQHSDRDADWRDVQPGLFYKVTPRLHIGGAVSFAPDQVDASHPGDPQAPPPRVRLETTFKF